MLVARYYWLLRSIVKEKPHLRKCLTRCRHCRIWFFTHPRNAGRKDLGCPFGCRQSFRAKSAIQRSIEYYQSPEGKVKKRYLNARRNGKSTPDEKPVNDGEPALDQAVVCHIQLTTRLIEGRAVSLKEILGMIEQILRQLSIDKRKKLPYLGASDHDNPP